MVAKHSSFLRTRSDFDRCWPFLESAIEQYGHTHSKEDIWERLEARKAYFFPLQRGVIVGRVLTYPTGLKESEAMWAGGDLQEILQWVPSLEAYAQNLGCSRNIIKGRRGWLKALDGYREVGTTMVKEF